MGSYVPSTPAQRQEMLEAIGLHDFRQLYRDVPEEMLLRDGLDLPEGMSELEVSRTMTAMAARNIAYSAVLRGAGAYDHYIPTLVHSRLRIFPIASLFSPKNTFLLYFGANTI